jgi:hypothetical protein
MKRTFTVTVEGEDARKRWFDADTIREHVEGWTDTVVTVTEITAVHAKEREVLSAALDMMEKNRAPGIEGLEAWGESIVVLNAKARELRALMEGKA